MEENLLRKLRINAIQFNKIGIADLIIDLQTYKVDSGLVIIYDDTLKTYPIHEYIKKYPELIIDMEDNAVYELLDKSGQPVTRQQGYMPKWISDLFNFDASLGIRFRFNADNIQTFNTMDKGELIEIYIKSLSKSNSTKEACLLNIGRLTALREKLSSKYLKSIEIGIESLLKDLQQWD